MADTTEWVLGQATRGVLLRNGRPVGVLTVDAAEYGQLQTHIESQGYRVQSAEVGQDGALEWEQQCEDENPRPCEVNITANMIADLAHESGLQEAPVDRVIAQGRFTEGQMANALQATIAEMPQGEARENAEMWYQAGFGEAEGGPSGA
jgi:hypothetical protein